MRISNANLNLVYENWLHGLYLVLLSIKASIDGSLPRKSDKISMGSFAPPMANTW